jgi:hypothetical protein
MKIYTKFVAIGLLFALTFSACKLSDFEEAYPDPSKISVSSVEKQFSGFLQTNREYSVPSYWNYFVILRITLNRYNQAVGWVNGENQYVPGSAAVGNRWDTYFRFLAQYREIEKIYNNLSDVEKADRKIYMIAANTYLYDHTQKVVDLHGDIPWSEAARLSQNGGNFDISYPKYDKAEDIYKKMLDDLKGYSDELNTISIKAGIQAGFKTQDFILKGDINAWKRYVNSLRLRMLSRVSASSTFSARAKTEIAEILGSPTKYPVVTSNAENIQINIFDLNSDINSKGFQSGLEDWNGNIASKAMIDHLKINKDPRLRMIFEPGSAALGLYEGLDQMADAAKQTEAIASNKISIFNRSTISRNQFFPGVLITASEVNLLASEYYLNNGNDALAKTQYEAAVSNSIDFYTRVRKISNDNTTAAAAEATTSEINEYLGMDAISWSKAPTPAAKITLIASQKWIHFNVIQAEESWAELRRLDALQLKFWEDNSNNQKTPPTRWFYPGSEQTYNLKNYQAVQGNDKLTTKIFWDIK